MYSINMLIFLEIDDGYHLKERASKKLSVGKVCDDEGTCQLVEKEMHSSCESIIAFLLSNFLRNMWIYIELSVCSFKIT